MSKHDATRPSNSATFYEIDMTGVHTSQSLIEQFLQEPFKHLAGDERRTAIKESLGEAEHKLKENLSSIKLLEEKIAILKRFLSDA